MIFADPRLLFEEGDSGRCPACGNDPNAVPRSVLTFIGPTDDEARAQFKDQMRRMLMGRAHAVPILGGGMEIRSAAGTAAGRAAATLPGGIA